MGIFEWRFANVYKRHPAFNVDDVKAVTNRLHDATTHPICATALMNSEKSLPLRAA